MIMASLSGSAVADTVKVVAASNVVTYDENHRLSDEPFYRFDWYRWDYRADYSTVHSVYRIRRSKWGFHY